MTHASLLHPTLLTFSANLAAAFRRREILRLQPNQIWQIETGFVRTTTWTQSGDIHTLGIWGAGDIVSGSVKSITHCIIKR
jgi:CRP-like cAMP-binding protein